MPRSRSFEESLRKRLRDPREAKAYINAVLENYSEDDPESRKLLLLAMKDIAEAQGGMTKLAKKTGLGRESLYKTLSSRGRPKLSTLSTLCHGMGFRLNFSVSDDIKHRP